MSYLCFDVGGTFVKYATLDPATAAFIEKSKYPTHADDPDKFFEEMADIANQRPEVEAIGISFPGFVDPDTGLAKRAGALSALDGMNLLTSFTQHLKRPLPVAIDNDAKCAALAEKLNGNATDVQNFAVLTLGTGVGCGIVLNGKVLHGGHFRAGEFGMSITDFSKSGYADLHDLASTSALVKSYAKAKHLKAAQVSGEMVMADLADPETEQIVHRWARYVALAIFNLVATIDPQRILIGGGISKNPNLLPYLQAALAENPFWLDYETEIAVCKHDNDAGVLGAFYIAKQLQA